MINKKQFFNRNQTVCVFSAANSPITKKNRVPPAPSRYDMVASGVTIRSYRSTSMIAEELSLRAWMVVPTPLRPWCGGAKAEDSGMFPEVWDSLGFLPDR